MLSRIQLSVLHFTYSKNLLDQITVDFAEMASLAVKAEEGPRMKKQATIGIDQSSLLDRSRAVAQSFRVVRAQRGNRSCAQLPAASRLTAPMYHI